MKTMSDTDRFIDHVRPLFGPDEVLLSRAPGRIDLMGGIADYSGSLVLQWPIAAATHVAIQLHDVPAIQICSLAQSRKNPNRTVVTSVREFESNGSPVDYLRARALFQADRHWGAYVAGAFL